VVIVELIVTWYEKGMKVILFGLVVPGREPLLTVLGLVGEDAQ
jgi:hypothetical protein